jgi:hypothetical protein
MNAQHTPGPWRAVDTGDGYTIESSSREMSATVAEITARRSVTGAADARLIAAAPDLLDLAKQYASECTECSGTGVVTRQYGGDGYGDRCAALADADQPCDECADIRAVIARAETSAP